MLGSCTARWITKRKRTICGVLSCRWKLWSRILSKAIWVDSRPLTLDARLHSVIGGGERTLFLAHYRPDDQLQRLCKDGQLDRGIDMLNGMEQHGAVPSVHAYSTILKACIKRRALPQVISGYTAAKQGQEALTMYCSMQEEGLEPNTYTFVSLLKACSSTLDLEGGKHIHAEALKYMCVDDPYVSTCLVNMYAKCGSFEDAWHVFHGLAERNVVLWNAMLAACSQQGHAEKALQLYEQMQEEGVSPDDRTFVSVLQACGILAEEEEQVILDGRFTKAESLETGKALHAVAHRKGYDVDVFVASTLIRLYGKCRSIADAQEAFDQLYEQDVVSWTALLATYAHQGQPEKALDLYRHMQEEGVSPDVRTFVSAIQICGMLADKEEDIVLDGWSGKVRSLEVGKAIHADAWRNGLKSNVFVGSTLVGMYGKCGSIVDAENVFNGLSHRTVVSWNAMLSAYVDHRQVDRAWQLYREMEEHEVSPNEITKVCILGACCNIGSLEICRQVHHSLLATATGLSLLLANTLVNAYGRCASMLDAQSVFDALLQPDVVSWTTLIAGYAREGNTALSLRFYQEMLLSGMKPNAVTFLSILCTCNHAGLVDEGVEYFESMSRDYGIPPEIEHYSCVVDLLGRAGYFTSLQQLLSTMPLKPDLAMWMCVLSSCRMHGKVVLGEKAFNCAVLIAPRHPAAYVLMLNIYLDAGLWDQAQQVKEMRQNEGARKLPGESWIEHKQEIHSFVVADWMHSQYGQLHDLLGEVTVEICKRWSGATMS